MDTTLLKVLYIVAIVHVIMMMMMYASCFPLHYFKALLIKLLYLSGISTEHVLNECVTISDNIHLLFIYLNI